MKKSIPWNEPVMRFDRHFGYMCQIPRFAEIESEKDFNDFSRSEERRVGKECT